MWTMKKLVKVIAIVIGILVVLLIATAVIVPLAVDPNDYKDRIVALVEEQTGRQLKVEGDIDLSLFPWLGVKIGAVELGNATGFENPRFARIEQLQVRVRILPLLSRRVEADVVRAQGLIVNLERDKDGRTNWDDLMRAETEQAPDREPSTVPGALIVGGVDIRDAAVTWTDQAAGQRLALSDLSVKTSAVTLVDPVDVKIGFAVDTGDIGLKGRFDSATRIRLDLKDGIYALEKLQLNAELKGETLPDTGLTMKGSGAATFDAGAGQLKLSQIRLEAEGLPLPPYTAKAVVQVEGTADLAAQTLDLPGLKVELTTTGGKDRIQASLAGNTRADLNAQKVTISELALNLPEFSMGDRRIQLSAMQPASLTVDLAGMTVSLKGLAIAGTVTDKALPEGSLPVALRLGLQGDLNRQTASVDPIQIEVLGMKADGKLSVGALKATPEVNGSFAVARFNPQELLARLTKHLPAMSDPKALSSAELAIAFKTTKDALNMTKINARLDDSTLTGSAEVTNFTSPNARFDLTIDRINLDRYRSPKQTVTPAAAAAPAVGPAASGGLPLEKLKKLSLNGKLRISDLVVGGVKMGDLAVAVQARDGLIQTDPITAALYGGAYSGALALDLRNPEPKIGFEEKLAGVHVDRLLKDLDVKTETADFRGASDMTLKGSIVTDAAFEVIRVEQLSAAGKLGGKLPLGLDGGGTVLNLKDQTLTAEQLKIHLGGMNLKVNTKVTDLSAKPSFTAKLSAPAFNLRQVLSKIGRKPPETADPKAMTAAELAATLSGSTAALSVEALKVRLDDTRLEGTLGLTLQPVPAYAFDLKADAIDLDRYLPPAKKGATPKVGTPGTATASVPLEGLRSLQLDGKLALGKMKLANVKFQDLRMQIKGKDGLVTLNPLGAALYGGTYKGNVSIDARGKQPRLSLDEKLANVQAGPLLKDLQGRALLTGLSGADMKLTATGTDANAIKRTLNGTVGFKLANGSIEGIDILGKICRALSAVMAGSFSREDLAAGVLQMAIQQARGESDEQSSANRTRFTEMGGSIAFKNGIGTNKDLLLKSPLLRVEGSGTLNLPKEVLDYRATAALVKSCEGQGGKGFKELANYPIPVNIRGPLAKPEVEPDLTAGIMQILGRRQAQEKRPSTAAPQQQPQKVQPQKDQREEMEDAARDLLQKGLKDLFNR
jgi:AsmA protein